MIAVSNSSPIIFLAKINKLSLLKYFFDKIVVPKSVYEEIVIKGAGKPGSKEVDEFDWIESKSISDTMAKDLLMDFLDEGEAEAIILAIELNADMLLIDDLAGRNFAKAYDITVMGTLGVLDQASKEGKIENLREVMNKLQGKGFWMSDELYEKFTLS